MLLTGIWYLAAAVAAAVLWYPFGTAAKRADETAEELLNELGHF